MLSTLPDWSLTLTNAHRSVLNVKKSSRISSCALRQLARLQTRTTSLNIQRCGKYQETKMINTKSKLAAVLAVAVAMTLSAASAEARVARHESAAHSTAVRHAHAEHRSYRGSYNYAPLGGGGHFVEPNGPDNYNPNES
jgi:hypothetical protein